VNATLRRCRKFGRSFVGSRSRNANRGGFNEQAGCRQQILSRHPDLPPEEGTGWHKHECEFQIVIMTKGWARFMYEDKSTLVQAGDVVHQRPGITHYLYDYSEDMEYLEIVSPADFRTVDVPPAVDKVPPPTPWK
jgi:uncharacterized cupin superfamily protein